MRLDAPTYQPPSGKKADTDQLAVLAGCWDLAKRDECASRLFREGETFNLGTQPDCRAMTMTTDEEKTQIWKDFRKFGKMLDAHGLNTSHSGNISVRRGDRIFITRRGSMSADIRKTDVIETGIYEDDSGIVLASTETGVHRAIYQNTSALAIIHAHPPYAIVLSLLEKEIIAVDAEGAYHMHKIPVLDLKVPVGAKEAAEAVPPVLKNYKAVMVRSHGVFATGSILEEAYMWVSIVDSITRLRYLALQAGYKDEHKNYEKW